MKMLIDPKWLREKIKEEGSEPQGCSYCGAIAGCCPDYPKCMGGEEAKLIAAKELNL